MTSLTAVTDRDRLTVAFARLEAEGIAARMDLACCQSCGQAELVDAERYVFWHGQDEDAAFGPRLAVSEDDWHSSHDDIGQADLYLAYDSVETGERVREVVEEEGLDIEWDGDLARRICVHGSGDHPSGL